MMKVRFIYILFILLFCMGHVHSSTHSSLKDTQALKRFKKVSLKLVCQCGCKMLLDSCNHLTCMAWSMRSIIDSLILHGHPNEFILNGFENGFGKSIHDEKIFPVLKEEKYADYLASYEKGFGTAVYSQPKGGYLTIYIFISAFILIAYAIFFIYRKRKKLNHSEDAAPLSEKEKELWKRLSQ